jgi:predicted transposase YdaD
LILSPLSLPFRLLRCRPDLSLIQSIALWNLLGALSEDVLYRRLKRERERERERGRERERERERERKMADPTGGRGGANSSSYG